MVSTTSSRLQRPLICVHFLCVTVKPRNFKSDGLRSFIEVSNTMMLACRKRDYFNSFHLLILTFFFTMCQSNYNVECLSIILALQRSNETYKYIKYLYTRVQVKMSDHNNLFCRNLFLSFFILVVATWMFLL